MHRVSEHQERSEAAGVDSDRRTSEKTIFCLKIDQAIAAILDLGESIDPVKSEHLTEGDEAHGFDWHLHCDRPTAERILRELLAAIGRTSDRRARRRCARTARGIRRKLAGDRARPSCDPGVDGCSSMRPPLEKNGMRV